VIGTTLAHYRVTASLGAGGMGEVWRATDSKLGREVALKALPAEFAEDPERLARFQREAKVLASLNHPNIAHLYGLETASSASDASGTGTGTGAGTEELTFLVMELVEGTGLDEVIARGAVPVEDAIPIALQIAEALEAAHEAGIVHRDLKPANVKIRPDGTVKVLDCGLAKAWEEGESTDLSLSPTLTRHATAAGVILGTAAYMSPEQAKGKPVDRRADIWAVGVVLWEMLTGRTLFDGETVTDVLAAVLTREPDLDALPPATPAALHRLLSRCLERDPKGRLQWIGDARLELDDAAEGGDDRAAPPHEPGRPPSRWRERIAWSLAAVALAAAGLTWWRSADDTPVEVTRFTIPVGDGRALSYIDEPVLAVSPDGRTLAFVATDRELGQSSLFLRRLRDDTVRPVPGTGSATHPFFSPDGRQIAFFADGSLKKVAVDGATPVTLADTPNPRGGVWLPDDTILYSPDYSAGLWRVAASGGEPSLVLDLDIEAAERTFRFPDVHPDGRTVLFTVGRMNSPNNYDDAQLVALSLDSGQRGVVVEGANMGRFVGEDTIAFSRAGVLYAVGFDPQRLEKRGHATPVIEDVGGDPVSGAGHFAIARNGTIAWVEGAVTDSDALLTVVDRNGVATDLPLEPSGFRHPRFSPDGTAIAVTVGEGRAGVSRDVWVYSFATETMNRVTFDGNERYPAWMPDGRRIAFLAEGDEQRIYAKPADGRGAKEPLTAAAPSPLYPESFSPDGRTIAYTQLGQTPSTYLSTSGGEPRLFEVDASSPVISPNGRWLAYASPGSGSARVFVRSIEGEGKWQVSPGDGSYPRWSRDGSRLFYIDIDRADRPLMEVDVADGEVFRTGPPRVVLDDLDVRFLTATAPAVNWDVSPDGNRFVFIGYRRNVEARTHIEVALGWAQQLKLETP